MNLNQTSVFLTVGSDEQKNLCEKLLADLNEKYNLNIIVVADDENGARLGSGGALLQLLAGYGCGADKMLVINCGGFSKRTVNYTLRGKAFANVQCNGDVVSLFELLVQNAKRLLDRFTSGVLVCCSDILVDTSDLQVTFDDNIGFCVHADFETASRHGVMFCDEHGLLAEYPHKCSADVLRAMAAKYNTDAVFADTGLLYFTDAVCQALHRAVHAHNIIETLVQQKCEINLYADIVSLFAQKNRAVACVENTAQGQITKILHSVLAPFTMKVCVAQGQAFMHFGSTAESLANILLLAKKEDTFLSFYSYIDNNCTVGKNTVLDNVILTKGCSVGNGCLLSDITLEDGVVIADGKTVCGIKLTDGSFVAVECDIDENPKSQVNGCELWDVPRFYKGKTFTDSLNKLRADANEQKYSLAYVTANADFDYCFNRQRYMKDRQGYMLNPQYLQKREQIIKQYSENKKPFSRVDCKTQRVTVSLPVRVNFSGTWTDAMPYCIDHGGQVINMAVTVNGENPVTVIAETLSDKRIEFYSDDSCTEYCFGDAVNEEDLSDFNLHIAVLQVMGITKETALDCGFRLTTKVSGIDKGSGLGTSSILLGGCIQALSELFGISYSEQEIMQMVFIAEQLMTTGGGWQDQVGGLLPSIKISTTEKGTQQIPAVQFIDLPDSFKEMFSQRLVLIPTGQRHFGRFIVNDVANRYLAGNADSLSGHVEIRALNTDVLNSIKSGDTQMFLCCLNRHFEILKKISPFVSDCRIDSMVSYCLAHVADAVSICGAGGGGYLLAILKEGKTVGEAQQQLKNAFPFLASDVKKADLFE